MGFGQYGLFAATRAARQWALRTLPTVSTASVEGRQKSNPVLVVTICSFPMFVSVPYAGEIAANVPEFLGKLSQPGDPRDFSYQSP